MENPKIEQARHLYFAQAKTQKEIAHILGVTEKTIYNWIKRHSWDQMRQAARQAPALITENLCSQLVELQNTIARREPGCRYADKEESLTMLRLVTALEKMKKFPGLAMNMQVLETFRNYVRPMNKDFTRDFAAYSSLFLEGYASNGYYPYQLEYGMDKVTPVDPFYEEEPIENEPPITGNIVPAPNDLSLGLPEDQNSQPENPSVKLSQNVEDQDSYTTKTTFPPPEKTGNDPEIPATSDNVFPWRNWLPDLQLPHKQSTHDKGQAGFPKD